MHGRLLGVGTSFFVLACTNHTPAEPKPRDDQSVAEPAQPATPAPAVPKPPQPPEPPQPPAPPKPPPDPVVEQLEFPEGRVPKWCEITLEVATAEVLDREGVCNSQNEPIDDCTIEASAWINEPLAYAEWGPISLFIPLEPDRFERVELAKYSMGTEEQEDLQHADVREEEPLDASIVMSHTTQVCEEGYDFEDRMCGFEDFAETLVAVTRLSDGRFLIATAIISLLNSRARKGFLGARVVVAGDKADVWACGGHATLPLPEGVPPQPEAVAPQPSTPDEAKAAGKRCAEGWSHFGAGELAAAKLDVDAALTVLERAEDAAGKRSLGACLYNRGRIAEQEGELAAAREFYRRSLAARPNDTVQTRLDSL